MRIYLTTLLLICCISSVPAATYRWYDEQGNLVFSDKPPKKQTATEIELKPLIKSGADFGSTSRNSHNSDNHQTSPPPKNSTQCRGDISRLNKMIAFQRHTPNKRDQQQIKDLRKLITKRCGRNVLKQHYNDRYCDDYRQEINKITIYLKHTPTDRDKQRLKDLKYQLKQEC